MKYLAANVGLIYENIYMRLERPFHLSSKLPAWVNSGEGLSRSCGLLWSNGHLASVGSLCSAASGYLCCQTSYYLANIIEFGAS